MAKLHVSEWICLSHLYVLKWVLNEGVLLSITSMVMLGVVLGLSFVKVKPTKPIICTYMPNWLLHCITVIIGVVSIC